MKKVFLILSILLSVVSTIGIVVLVKKGGSGTVDGGNGGANVSVVDGKQVVQISAKGGYAPRNTTAKADMPTTLNIKTNGTFDCSSAFAIPSLGYRTNLPPSGVTPIEIPPQPAGTTLKGVCAMGMYSFAVNFK